MSYLTLEGQGYALISWKAISDFIAVIPLDPCSTDWKARAKAVADAMGPRYIGHESRRIKMGDYVPQEVHRCDIAETFRRIRAQIAAEPGKIIVEGVK